MASTLNNAHDAGMSPPAPAPALTTSERAFLAVALALSLKVGEHTPDVGITDWNDYKHVFSVCLDIVDRMPAARARLHLVSLAVMQLPESQTEAQRFAYLLLARMIDHYVGEESDTTPRPPMIDVLTTPGIGQVSGMLADPPKLELRPSSDLYTDIHHDPDAPNDDPERLDRVHEVVHLRTHDVVILACERDIVIMTSDEFHSQV